MQEGGGKRRGVPIAAQPSRFAVSRLPSPRQLICPITRAVSPPRSDHRFKKRTVNAPTIEIAPLLGPEADPAEAGLLLRQLGAAPPDQAPDWLNQLTQQIDQMPQSDPAIVAALLRAIHSALLKGDPAVLATLAPPALQQLDHQLPSGCPNRHLLLHLLVLIRSPQSLQLAVQCLQRQPPKDSAAAGQVLSPLLQHQDWPLDAVFPALFDCLEHSTLASPILDLANYLYRSGRVNTHLAAERAGWLTTLLAAVTQRLEKFESDPRSFGDDIPTVQMRLAEAVSLAVSLCDAIGLIGWKSAMPRLTETMQLKHRRVQSEAAGALARMGDELGIKHLVTLAEEPSARLRVIAYADELNLGDQIDPQYRTMEATAEAEIALWLSQPSQMGVPPTMVETIDQRHQYWPSYDSPLDCLLVRYAYNMGDRMYSNVGITGPVTYAMANAVADLPVDDIYAIYAGWHADHADIFAIAAEHLNSAQQRVVRDRAAFLQRADYEQLQCELFGVFLEEQAVVFRATHDDKPCLVITDESETIVWPRSGQPRELAAADLWNLYKGRKMLRSFN